MKEAGEAREPVARDEDQEDGGCAQRAARRALPLLLLQLRRAEVDAAQLGAGAGTQRARLQRGEVDAGKLAPALHALLRRALACLGDADSIDVDAHRATAVLGGSLVEQPAVAAAEIPQHVVRS